MNNIRSSHTHCGACAADEAYIYIYKRKFEIGGLHYLANMYAVN